MPSKSEPCGLAQMVACRYGTPPIVRETGGLRDSIHDSTMGEGNGFTFAGYNAHELYVACCNAQNAYYDKENWKNLVHHCMEQSNFKFAFTGGKRVFMSHTVRNHSFYAT